MDVPACQGCRALQQQLAELMAVLQELRRENEERRQENQKLQQRIRDLEAQLGKSPRNSSLPPSSEHPHAKPPPPPSGPSGRRRGGQPGHAKAERPLVPPEQLSQPPVVLKPEQCRCCRTPLRGSDPQPLRHQVWELPVCKPIIIEYQRHRLPCPCCGTVTAANLPEGVPRGQSGPRLTAAVALLMASFRQSKRRVGLLLETLFGIPCSPGLAVKLQRQATAALTPCYQELCRALPNAPHVHLDESPTKQGQAKAWLWAAVAPQFTVFAQRLTRAAEVARDLLGCAYAGVVHSDRYASYDWLPLRQRQLCWAHLLRDFQALADRAGAGRRIGADLLKAGHTVFHHWHRFRNGVILRPTLRRRLLPVQYDIWAALERGMRCRDSDVAGVCGHIFDRFDALWTFLKRDGIQPTNNDAERALRHAVIWRKLSFGTQSATGSRFVECLLTVIETCRQQSRPVWDFATHACQSFSQGQPAATLLPAV
jgi:transposase